MSEIVKQSFEDLIQDIHKNPEKATANFEATALLREKLTVKGTTRQFNCEFDEPDILGGDDSAPKPVEYVLATLGACRAITYKALASLKGIQVDNVVVKVKGYTDLNGFLGLNKETRPSYLKVEVDAVIESKEDPEILAALYKQVEAVCPVLDIFANTNKVKGKLTVQNNRELVA
ncbi:hypothetical protein KCTC52924_00999 [Arenibacter antarcticus]|uniref:OsmC family protein n=1 Tax=Arenibacter antarcticus TaxID=2040469 RepID=A0ABW5VCH1_9FLAO|nr:OsmC family protein [Arenibacter sp. H213]MCM4167502.1 osmotically inducible protein OsmC [Arenibacter sp. H213]